MKLSCTDENQRQGKTYNSTVQTIDVQFHRLYWKILLTGPQDALTRRYKDKALVKLKSASILMSPPPPQNPSN